MNSANRIILIGIVILIVALFGYFAWQERSTSAPTSSTTATTISSTSTGATIDISPTRGATTTGGYTIKAITAPAAPNYKTPLSYSAGFDATEKAQDESQFASVQTVLTSNPTDYSAWLELGILRESTGDYTGAAADWKYVTQIYSSDPTAYANLGNLYANYLHQPPQGIAYYKLAIKLDPTREETFYDNLAQIYLSQGDTADAKTTLQQGITARVVGYQNLQNELDSMQ